MIRIGIYINNIKPKNCIHLTLLENILDIIAKYHP